VEDVPSRNITSLRSDAAENVPMPLKMFAMRATFVGICNIDLYSECPRLPIPGETIAGTKLSRGFGGKASNACSQYAFLASDADPPSLLTAVGTDASGREFLDHFARIRIRTDLVQIRDGATGLAICFVLAHGESAIVIHPCPVTLDMISICQSAISASQIVVTNFEIPPAVAAEALRIGASAGATTILNAAPVPPDLDFEVFRHCKIVIANKIEMEAIGTPEKLFGLGVSLVIVTIGRDGAVLYEKGADCVKVPSLVVEAVDSTGAGDSFLGAFAYGIAKGMVYEQVARLACVAAAISVQSLGAQQSYVHAGDPRLKF
jgi:ribokinase